MTPRPDINKLAKEIFEVNKAKGFHDKEQSNETLLMLVICELSEAVEADRKRKRAKWDAYDKDLNYFCNWSKQSIGYKEKEIHAFSVYIKDTLEDELADAVIRLLDLAGLRKLRITTRGLIREDKIDDFRRLPEFAFWLIDYLFSTNNYILNNKSLSYKISRIIPQIEYYCEKNQIDLWLHVDLKLKYNQTRPIKHGKNY